VRAGIEEEVEQPLRAVELNVERTPPMSASPPRSRSDDRVAAQLSLGRAELVAALRAAPRRRLRDAAERMLDDIEHDARKGRSVLSDLLGRRAAFEVWEHYPARDAVDAHSGYRFYYHAHERRSAGEHGHFHVFAPLPPRAGEADYVHLVGLSVDARGFPLRVFTTNQWVTAERWVPAPRILRALDRLDLSHARPSRVARWVQDSTRLFAPQIAAVVRRRDARIAQRAMRLGEDSARQDRRTHIVSQCRVDLSRQFEFMEAAGFA
jgi:hypothetical protein